MKQQPVRCRCPQCGRLYDRTYREDRDGFGVCTVDRAAVVRDALSVYARRKFARARLELQAVGAR